MEKYCKAEQAKDDKIIRPKRIACWIIRLHTHSEHVILIAHTHKHTHTHAHTHTALKPFDVTTSVKW